MKNYPHGNEFEFKELYPSQVKYDPLYQRPLDERRVNQIVKEFNGNVFNEPKVSWRDGVFWCFNGQHSIAAWKKLHNNEDKLIYCKVFRGMTWADECEAFVAQNGISKDPTTTQKLRARYNSGAEDVQDMVKKAELCGYIVDFSSSKIPKRIVAVSALFKAYKSLQPDAYLDMLTVLSSAWDGDMDAVDARIITGMASFFRLYYGNFKVNDLVNSLKKIAPATIIRNGKGSTEKGSYMKEILKSYNKNRSRNRLEEKI